ncbi:MFS transporter [Piscibacillus sp. B03]|uniref:MFS transporter n=1 Tax=Piscibacillus sp. B03 TaxID=3457430 RepID=UPI003FCD2CBF
MSQTQIGIKQNIIQFTLLVFINLFVGFMVGLERTVLPMVGESHFGLASASAALSFIVSFGFSKAAMNFFAGGLADRFGRREVLLVGWGIGLLVPILVIVAHAWWVIVFANILLGINQGLTWSMTLNMKIDLARGNQRGIAVGFNEFAGYIGVGLMAAISGYVASQTSIRPEPFYLGIGIVVIGFILSLFAQDTEKHVQAQSDSHDGDEEEDFDAKEVFKKTTYKDRELSTLSFAGLSTNLKDGMAWGLFPVFLTAGGLTVGQVGAVVAAYPAAWGFFQLFTGIWSDRIGRKGLIVSGMIIQALALWMFLLVDTFTLWMTAAIILGIGTAMVYPTIIAGVGDASHPKWRATSLGYYRFWRDSGYAFGALFAGIFTDLLNVEWAIGLVAILPLLAGLRAIRMKETMKMI